MSYEIKYEVTNRVNKYYRQVGVLIDRGVKGGVYLKFEDGNVTYIPYGYQIVEIREKDFQND
jgi:hypothetical protein